MSPTLSRARHLLDRAIAHQTKCNTYADQLPYDVAQTLRDAAQRAVEEAQARAAEIERACASLARTPRTPRPNFRIFTGGAL
jgi:plasmid stabilization system protein ParE